MEEYYEGRPALSKEIWVLRMSVKMYGHEKRDTLNQTSQRDELILTCHDDVEDAGRSLLPDSVFGGAEKGPVVHGVLGSVAQLAHPALAHGPHVGHPEHHTVRRTGGWRGGNDGWGSWNVIVITGSKKPASTYKYCRTLISALAVNYKWLWDMMEAWLTGLPAGRLILPPQKTFCWMALQGLTVLTSTLSFFILYFDRIMTNYPGEAQSHLLCKSE